MTPGERDVERINAEREAAGSGSTQLLRGVTAKSHAEKVNREYGITTPIHRYTPHEMGKSPTRKHSVTGEEKSEMTPGERDVERINAEKEAEGLSPRHMLRGITAKAHAEKVNREQGIFKPIERYTPHEHEQSPPRHSKHDTATIGSTEEMTPGERDVERLNAEKEAEGLSPRHMLKGISAKAHAEKVNREHGIHKPIERYTYHEHEQNA